MQINRKFLRLKKHSGFTLIELIIGIVVLSISFSIIMTTILPAAKQSAEQIHQIRAAELGQSMINEILGKAFDHNSDMAGGLVRCGEASVECTDEVDLGPENGEVDRTQFNDVDDYNNLDSDNPLQNITNSLNINIDGIYRGFRVTVKVCYDGDYDGICFADDVDGSNGDEVTAKLITITVTTAQGLAVKFATYKANF